MVMSLVRHRRVLAPSYEGFCPVGCSLLTGFVIDNVPDDVVESDLPA